jgi:6-phosphofructokinase 1
VTRQEGAIVPIPFADLMNPETGRTRVRNVDTTTDSFQIARSLQVRLEPEDLRDEALVLAVAEAGGLTPQQVRERFGPR